MTQGSARHNHYDRIYSENQFPFWPSINDFVSSKIIIQNYEKLIGNNKQQLRVVDLGCGPGNLLRLLQEIHPLHEYYGVDRSQVIVQTNNRATPSVIWVCSDVVQTAFPDAYFDVVLSTMVIEHVDDHALVEEIVRLLRPGGILLISSVVKGAMAWYYLKNEKGESVLEKSHLREYLSEAQFLSLFEHRLHLLVSDTCQIAFPLADFMLRRLYPVLSDRMRRSTSIISLGNKLRKLITIPIPGYYSVECLFTKL